MKKVFLIIVIAIVSTSTFAQTSQFSFCKISNETIALKTLQKCPVLSSKNKNVELKSFLLSIVVQKENFVNALEDSTSYESMYVEYKITGNTITKNVFSFLEKPHKSHFKVIIEDVLATEYGKEFKDPGFTFFVH